MGIMPTEAELALEQSQQGVSYEVSRSTRFYRLSHSEIVDIEKVAVRSSLRSPNNKCTDISEITRKQSNCEILDESSLCQLDIDFDKFMMKAQVHVSKSSVISDVQALPQENIIDTITHVVLVIMSKKMLREIVNNWNISKVGSHNDTLRPEQADSSDD
ncbi:hypothetical protein Tco_0304597 [Tanacetum coccineum]